MRPTGESGFILCVGGAAVRDRATQGKCKETSETELGLAGKTALVTGGSKGIGLETARALAREGVKVLICARREAALAEAAHDIAQTTQSKVETQPLDVTKVDQIETIRGIVREKLGRIDILVNNAGTGTYKPFLDVTDASLSRADDQFLRTIPHLSAHRADDDRARRRPYRQCGAARPGS